VATFREFVKLCERLRLVSSINDKTSLIASFMEKLDREEWKPFTSLLVGKAVPEKMVGGLGIGYMTVKKASQSIVKPLFPPPPPTISDVYNQLQAMARLRGVGSLEKKYTLLSSLFSSLGDEERPWLIKIIYGELRIGVDIGHLLKAISIVTGLNLNLVRRAYMLRGSLEDLIDLLINRPGDIRTVNPRIFNPVRPMLAYPAEDVEEAISMVGGDRVALEFKYDGARVQVHIGEDIVKIFSRRLSDVTTSLPDVVEVVRDKVLPNMSIGILEGEVIAVRDGRPLPFQELMKRFKRIRNIDLMVEEIPTRIYFFDVIYVDGSLLIDHPYRERYNILKSYVPSELLADRIVTDNIREAEEFYRKALSSGHEGIMVKRLDSPYVLGSRGKHWIKVKAAEYVDLVIVGAEWGHGRRRGWLSDYYLAAYDPSTGNYEVVDSRGLLMRSSNI
jgi:DNA ligase-1